MFKKTITYLLIVILALLTVLTILPFFFKDKIKQKAQIELNQMFNAKIDFSDINMSFIRNFPNVSVKLEDFCISGVNEFKNDTLINSKDINLIINIKSLFGNNGYDIKKLEFNDSKILAHVLPNGKANWEIMKPDSTQTTDTSAMNFHLKLKEFIINNADIVYNYEPSKMRFTLKGVNHTTSGDLTADSSMLVTKTTCDSLSFNWEGVDYISKATAAIDATINANLNQMKFTFSDNISKLNDIEFSLVGWLKGIPEGWDMDIALETRKNDFKSILSMIPALYAKSFEDIKTGGDFQMKGTVKGIYSGNYYPAFDLQIKASNGWFQYPSLPKSVQNIQIKADISNPGKTLDETIIKVADFSFTLGGNPFKASFLVTNPMTDTYVEMNALGKINLGMIKEVYPLDEKTNLNGLFETDLKLATHQSDIEQSRYERIKFAGKMNINKLVAQTSALPQKIEINEAKMLFNNKFIELPVFKVQIGKNDISATGKLENFVAYALQNKTLKGNLNIQSNYLNTNDFMSSTTTNVTKDSSSTAMTVIHIPANINLVMQANIQKLIYDKMNLSQVKGQLIAANSELIFNEVGFNGFGGSLVMNGLYNTADTLKPKVNLELQIKEVVFKEIFGQIQTFQKFAPILGKAAGKFSTTLQFNSLLKNNMMPDLTTIVGGGAFKTQQVGLSNVPAIDMLASKLNKSDIVPMTIKDLAVHFEIKDGKINTKPFSFKVKDTNFTLGGSTGLDKTIAYSGKVQLPDRMNLGKFSSISFKMGGTFQKPKIELDLKNTATEIVNNVKVKVETEVAKKVEDVKEKALEEARKQKENAIKEATAKAEKLIADAEKQGNILIDEAKKQGDALIAKATNPLTKKAAEIGAKKLEETARKQAAAIVAKAKTEAQKQIDHASNAVNL